MPTRASQTEQDIAKSKAEYKLTLTPWLRFLNNVSLIL